MKIKDFKNAIKNLLADGDEDDDDIMTTDDIDDEVGIVMDDLKRKKVVNQSTTKFNPMKGVIFTMMATVNYFCSVSNPCLCVFWVDDDSSSGISTILNGITYDSIMRAVNSDNAKIIMYTDGHTVTTLKDEIR